MCGWNLHSGFISVQWRETRLVAEQEGVKEPISPNFSDPIELEAFEFKVNADGAASMCIGAFAHFSEAIADAEENSKARELSIIEAYQSTSPSVTLEGALKAVEVESEKQKFFSIYGWHFHLATLVITGCATLDTVTGTAIRLMQTRLGLRAPEQNNRGSSIRANLPAIESFFSVSIISPEDLDILWDFVQLRNLLIHQGFFFDAKDKRLEELKRSDWHVDFFEILDHPPIILRPHGVERFLDICANISSKTAVLVLNAVIEKRRHSKAPRILDELNTPLRESHQTD